MEILHQTIVGLLSSVNSVQTSVTVNYAGSVLSPATTTNVTIPYTQTEVITFSVDIFCLGVTVPYQVYQTVDVVRDQLLGKRVVAFDRQVSGIAEVSSKFLGQVEPGKYGHILVIEVKRPRTVNQTIC